MTVLLTTNENGSLTIPSELLFKWSPRARVHVEQVGDTIVLGLDEAHSYAPGQGDRWLAEWKAIAQDIGDSSSTDRSVVDILSEMRR